ncbi:MAG: PAS domain-containing protein [Gammaproteobacteria bacterium]|nr:PAS domain-containing protein [Gammaproteobacteria bacterium]
MPAKPLTATEDLTHAFQAFEQVSAALTRSYERLERRVGSLAQLRVEPRLPAPAGAREGRYAAVLGALPGGVVIIDGDGRIEDFNAAALDLLGGLERGASWRDLVGALIAPRWDDGHDLTLANGRRVHIATQALAGQPGQVLLVNDVTDTRRLQDELHRYKRLAAEGNLASAIAHQIRTPLATALLYAGHLRRDDLDAGRRSRYATHIVERLRHLERLVEDMLLYARCGRFECEPMSLAGVLETLGGAAEAQTLDGAFTVHIDAGAMPAGLLVEAHRDALVSALNNLVANAREAGARALTITVARPDAGHVELAFADDGPGVAAEHTATIFEPFFTTRTSGTGLGLAVVSAVAHAHGGDVRLDAGGGPGARFCVRLPCRMPIRAH